MSVAGKPRKRSEGTQIMILVGQYDSPFVRRVAITLHHYDMPFGRNTMSVFTHEMAKINPLIRIPSLVLDDGETLVDSAAILDHLDEIAGVERALTPRAGADRRRVMQLATIAAGTADKLGAFIYEKVFHGPGKRSDEWLARCERQFRSGLDHLERQLTDEWLALGRFTQADVTAGVMLGYIHLRVPEVDLARDYPRLAGLSARCEARPSFAANRPSPDEAMPAQRA
jgi:glutathione S-transferase